MEDFSLLPFLRKNKNQFFVIYEVLSVNAAIYCSHYNPVENFFTELSKRLPTINNLNYEYYMLGLRVKCCVLLNFQECAVRWYKAVLARSAGKTA